MSYTRALAALHETTYGGVYYTADIDFADSGHNPTWTRLATTGLANLLVKVMQNDKFTPYDNIYVQLDNNDVYKWNGSSWDKIMDTTIAATYAAGCDRFGYICVDPTTPGVIYYPIMDLTTYVKLLKSTDYGASWSVVQVVNGIYSGIPYVKAIGDTLAVNCTGAAGYRLYFSYNGGGAWVQATPNPGNNYGLDQNPHNPAQVYMRKGSALDYDLNLHTGASATTLQAGLNLGSYFTSTNPPNAHWIDPAVDGHERIIIPNGSNLNMFYTTDQWSTVNTPVDWAGSYRSFYSVIAADLGNSDNMLMGGAETAGGAGNARISAKVGDNDNEPWIASGANYASSPYTDSIPGAANLYVAYAGLWVGEGPAPKGIYVYADELGDITNIPDYDGLGAPMFGDRAAWRDRRQDGNDIYHAEDVHRNEREIHAPQPSGNDGYGIVEVGGFWVNSSDVMVTGAGGGLTVTEVDGVPSIAATTLEFPNGTVTDEGGGVARYTPGAPAHALDDHTDVDLTGAAQGDIIYDNGGTWEDYPLGIGTNVVNDGSEIKLGDVANGNYVNIDTGTGELSLVGTATAFEDLQVTLTIRDTGATTYNPSFTKWFDDAAGTSRGVYVYGFDDHHTNEKELFFTAQFKHAQKLSALIHPHVHWIGKSSQNNKKVQWGLEYTWKSPGQVFGDTVIAYANTPISGNANITAYYHEITEFADLLPDDTCNDLSSILIGRLFRNSSNTVNDTYTDDVGLLAIDFHVEIDSFGSSLEYSKTEPTPPPAPSLGIIPVQVFSDLDNMTGPLLDDGSDKLENEIMS